MCDLAWSRGVRGVADLEDVFDIWTHIVASSDPSLPEPLAKGAAEALGRLPGYRAGRSPTQAAMDMHAVSVEIPTAWVLRLLKASGDAIAADVTAGTVDWSTAEAKWADVVLASGTGEA